MTFGGGEIRHVFVRFTYTSRLYALQSARQYQDEQKNQSYRGVGKKVCQRGRQEPTGADANRPERQSPSEYEPGADPPSRKAIEVPSRKDQRLEYNRDGRVPKEFLKAVKENGSGP